MLSVDKEVEKEEKKFTSRKFIVWVVATILFVAILALGFFLGETKIAEDFVSFWGGISMLYIGGNVAQDFAYNLGKKSEK